MDAWGMSEPPVTGSGPAPPGVPENSSGPDVPREKYTARAWRKWVDLVARAEARWGRDLGRLLRNPALVAGAAILGGYLLIALLAPLAYPGDPNSLPIDNNVLYACTNPSAPTLELDPFSLGPHPLGQTAHLGFDVLRALALGTRWDLLLLGMIVGVSALVGMVLGGLAGFKGGWLDSLLSPVFDGVLAFPPFLIVAVAVLLLPGDVAIPARIFAFVGAMLAVLWAPYAQGVRAQARLLSRQPYVEAARASGAPPRRVLRRHILPNCISSVLAQVPATLFGVLSVLGVYQYLGLIENAGAYEPPCGRGIVASGSLLMLPSVQFPEWTWTLANGALGYNVPGFGLNAWWGYLIPAAWIAIFLFGVSLLCDGLVSQLSPFERH